MSTRSLSALAWSSIWFFCFLAWSSIRSFCASTLASVLVSLVVSASAIVRDPANQAPLMSSVPARTVVLEIIMAASFRVWGWRCRKTCRGRRTGVLAARDFQLPCHGTAALYLRTMRRRANRGDVRSVLMGYGERRRRHRLATNDVAALWGGSSVFGGWRCRPGESRRIFFEVAAAR